MKRPMQLADLAEAARRFRPLDDGADGKIYRCAARLTDGLFLPCVALASAEPRVNLALRRFEETRADELSPRQQQRHGRGFGYRDIVQSFVTQGATVNWYDIAEVEESDFALSPERLSEIKGETSMGWTRFVCVMADGREFSFGTTFSIEFFDMPAGYAARDVVRILPDEERGEPVYRERPFFTCYLDTAI
jgi:hypothetical protein